MQDELDIPNRNIVFVGNFNPAIIQPSFLRRFKILPDQEITVAEDTFQPQQQFGKLDVKVSRLWISSGQTLLLFQTVVFDMTRDKFVVTLRSKADPLSVVNGLKKLFTVLKHTPVSAVGFNCHAHWKTSGGLNRLQKLFTGDDKLFKNVFGPDVNIGGKVRFKDLGAHVTLETDRSAQLDGGIYFSFNFHYDIADMNAERLIDLLGNFEKTISRAKAIASKLYGKPIDAVRVDDIASAFGQEESK